MAENRFYWLKLKRDFFKRHDIQIVESMPNGKDYVLFYLKLLVESIDHEGELRFSDTIPYNADMLATITLTNVDIVRAAMKIFSELGMIEILEDKTIYMNEVRKMIGSAADNENANRQRRFREAKKEQALLERYSSVTKNNESKNKSKNKELDINTMSGKPDRAGARIEIIRYLNEKTGKNFRHSTNATVRLIEARLNEGYTLEDFKKVIDNKTAEWKGTEQEQYLRPETLFAPSHFESYLNQRAIKAKPKAGQLSEEMSHGYDLKELARRAKE